MTENGQETPKNGLETPENTPRPPRRMLTAVERDLARMEDLNTGVRGSLAALARELAAAMDATGDDKPTPAQVGQLGAQLRVTLNTLADVGGDKDAADAFFRLMSTAVRPADNHTTDRQPRAAVPVSGDDT